MSYMNGIMSESNAYMFLVAMYLMFQVWHCNPTELLNTKKHFELLAELEHDVSVSIQIHNNFQIDCL